MKHFYTNRVFLSLKLHKFLNFKMRYDFWITPYFLLMKLLFFLAFLLAPFIATTKKFPNLSVLLFYKKFNFKREREKVSRKTFEIPFNFIMQHLNNINIFILKNTNKAAWPFLIPELNLALKTQTMFSFMKKHVLNFIDKRNGKK